MRWTKARLSAFKRAIDKARKLNRYEFTFAGQPFNFEYAEYYIRFLEAIEPTTKNESDNKTPTSPPRP